MKSSSKMPEKAPDECVMCDAFVYYLAVGTEPGSPTEVFNRPMRMNELVLRFKWLNGVPAAIWFGGARGENGALLPSLRQRHMENILNKNISSWCWGILECLKCNRSNPDSPSRQETGQPKRLGWKKANVRRSCNLAKLYICNSFNLSPPSPDPSWLFPGT